LPDNSNNTIIIHHDCLFHPPVISLAGHGGLQGFLATAD
jgi:hypothetical protein